MLTYEAPIKVLAAASLGAREVLTGLGLSIKPGGPIPPAALSSIVKVPPQTGGCLENGQKPFSPRNSPPPTEHKKQYLSPGSGVICGAGEWVEFYYTPFILTFGHLSLVFGA